MEKSYRIHTNISQDTLLNVNMKQSFDYAALRGLSKARYGSASLPLSKPPKGSIRASGSWASRMN